MMVGRSLDSQFPHVEVKTNKMILEVDGLSNNYIHDISFQVYSCEILGITGLVGAGRTELAKTICGVYPWHKGSIRLNGKNIHPGSPKEAIKEGIFYLTEDRKRNGLILSMNIKENTSLASLQKVSTRGVISERLDRKYADEYVEKMQTKTPSIFQKTKFLSGGNQQKVVISKALMSEPDVLILDEPTRGIDVGAKNEIYNLINNSKKEGKAVIMISSEMPEILGMSDRILVLHEGRIKGELTRENASQEEIMRTIIN